MKRHIRAGFSEDDEPEGQAGVVKPCDVAIDQGIDLDGIRETHRVV
jgi:hypothetical protein